MSRPTSHPSVSHYQPRFPSPLSAPPIQDRTGSPPKHDLSVLSGRNPSYGYNGNSLIRSSAFYSRGRRREHGRSASVPVVQHETETLPPPPITHTKPRPRPKPAYPRLDQPSAIETLEARVVSGVGETRDVTDVQAHFNVTTTTYPSRHLEQQRPVRTNKPLPPRPHSSLNQSSVQDSPLQPPALRDPNQPHAAVPLPRRPPSSVTRPRSSGSDFRSRDDESRDLLARMAAHSRSLSSEKRYWEAIPKISAPREVNPAQFQQPRPRASMVVATNRRSGLNEHVAGRIGEEREGGSRGLGVWKYIADCFGRTAEADKYTNTGPYTEASQSPQVEDLHARLGFRRSTDPSTYLTAHHDDNAYTSPPAPSMSKLRKLRLSKLRKSRAPSIMFDVPLTTIQPEAFTASTIRAASSTGGGFS